VGKKNLDDDFNMRLKRIFSEYPTVFN